MVARDRELETAADRSRIALAEHRWHWTLDGANPERVSFREYARAIGRHDTTVRDMVNGFAAWREGCAPLTEFGDYQARAKLRGDTLAATEAVAQAKGVGIEAARRHHAAEVREVKATAQERAERRGTTVADEMTAVAAGRARARAADANAAAARKAAHSTRYVEAEGRIAVAMRHLRLVLDESEGVEFTADERELIADAIGQLRALLNLLDVRVLGSTDVDWDAELAKLNRGAS